MKSEFFEKLEIWMQGEEYKKIKNDEKDHQKKLQKFLNIFTEEHIRNMPIDNYAFGWDKPENFCPVIENGLSFYGEISGKTTAYQRYVLYWSEEKNRFVFGDKRTKKRNGFGSTVEEIYPNIIKNILKVIEASKNEDYEEIARNPLNPMFKNKISYLYNSDKQVPIYNDEHLNSVLAALGIPFDLKEDRVYKRNELYNFYVKQGVNKKMSTALFICFIYSTAGYLSSIKQTVSHYEIKDYSVVDIQIDPVDPKIMHEKGKTNKFVYNPESEATKRITGKKGESIVIDYINLHKKELDAHNVKLWSGEDDGIGFDISYEKSDGTKIYVEVKATKSNLKDEVRFEMSSNELDFMREHGDTYYIYFVNNVDGGKVIQRILGKEVHGEVPVKYRLDFKPKNKESTD